MTCHNQAKLLRSVLGAFALLGYGALAQAQQSVAHVEGCTDWRFENGSFGTQNGCKQPIVIQFMLMSDQRISVREVEPGNRFDTKLSPEAMKRTGWLFTACPVGRVPNPPLGMANEDAILKSLYNCVKK